MIDTLFMADKMSLILGRLGLDQARIPHKSRHGIMWLSYGNLNIESGCLRFASSGMGELPAGCYDIPHQAISAILLGPGTTISHDCVRILSSQGCAIIFVGGGGVRIYSAPPLIPDRSKMARLQAEAWGNPSRKLFIARKMMAIRFGEVLPHKNLDVLRGIEGARVKNLYKILADKYGIKWNGRKFDRNNPDSNDVPNNAINHATTALYSAAAIAVYVAGAIPQLGFLHEDSGESFCLDIADLYRMEIAVPIAFSVAKKTLNNPEIVLEREVRREMGKIITTNHLVDAMIDRIKDMFEDVDSYSG